MGTKFNRVRTFVYDEEVRFEEDLNAFLDTVINPKVTYASNSIVYDERVVTVLTAFVEYEEYK
jgi:hypothetical protein